MLENKEFYVYFQNHYMRIKKGFTSPHHRTKEVIGEILNNSNGRILYNIYQATTL